MMIKVNSLLVSSSKFPL